MSAGKGDKPRNCFSKKFKNNYDSIDWKRKTCKKCGEKILTKYETCPRCGEEYAIK